MSQYDYLIVGGGCAGLSLAWQLVRTVGPDARILIMDRDTKTIDDRSWACWTKGPLPLGLDAIVHHRWSALAFGAPSFHRRQELEPYTYKLIRSIDYYDFVREQLARYPGVHWQLGEVSSVGQTTAEAWACIGEKRFTGDYLFDSRPQPAASSSTSQYFLWQHFHGIKIRTEQPCFDATTATLMDFRAIPAGDTAFFYVLPFSSHEALIEYTVFSRAVDQVAHYERQLSRYCQEVLGLTDYQLLDTETGKIPMTNQSLHPGPQGRIHPIGTAAGCVKPTTGYAFLRIHAHNADLVAALVAGRPLPARKSAPARFAWYDNLLLYILSHFPERGPEVFGALFRATDFRTILRFLDERSGLADEVEVFRRLPIGLFLRAAWSHQWNREQQNIPPLPAPVAGRHEASTLETMGP